MKADKIRLVTAMSIRMLAEISVNESGVLEGRLHSQYLEEPYIFTDLVHMIHKMEEIFDENGFPQAFLSPRSFHDKKNKAQKPDVLEGRDIMATKPGNDTESPKCTFEITVGFRQNATWQGHILWIDKNLKQNFRSVLEMLKLMDEALSEGDKDDTVSWK